MSDAVLDPDSGLPIGQEVSCHPAIAPSACVLDGHRIRLEPLNRDAHTESLWSQTHGPDQNAVWQYLFETPFENIAAFADHVGRKAASLDPLFFAIINKETPTAVGYETLMRIDVQHRCIEVGNILYGADLRGTAAATEAQYLLMRYVFDDLGFRRYEWKCNALNAPSRRAALRFGFSFEGVFRQHMLVRGRSRDTAWFSMLYDEWVRIKPAYEAWLAPGNFGPNGQQKQSLQELRDAFDKAGRP